MTLTETYIEKLKKIGPDGDLRIKAADCTMSTVQALYRAARKAGMKITVRNTPDGMRLWRLK